MVADPSLLQSIRDVNPIEVIAAAGKSVIVVQVGDLVLTGKNGILQTLIDEEIILKV